jgi:hypothetical protein
MFKPEAFLRGVRAGAFGGKMSKQQEDGCIFLVGQWRSRPRSDQRHLAYALATAEWETDGQMQPIDDGSAERFRGRGYILRTGQPFYERISSLCSIDLVAEPERLLEPEIAAESLFNGLQAGAFTGDEISTFLNDTTVDWVGARRAAGDLHNAGAIASVARAYWVALQGASNCKG